MGANAQTSVPTFTAGEVLTAANMNISARTGVPVFADTTARDAAFGGAGEKTLAEGQLAYIEASNVVQYYDGAAWATVGPSAGGSGLTLISSTTIGNAVSSVTVSSAFSATYDNYKVMISGGVASLDGQSLRLQLGATTTDYYWSASRPVWAGTYSGDGASADSAFTIGFTNTTVHNVSLELLTPFDTNETVIYGANVDTRTGSGRSFYMGGVLHNSISYTAFTITPTSGTLTGGKIRVYGYANS